MFHEEEGGGGFGPWQQLKNDFLEPTHYLQNVGAMIVNFIRWVIDYVKVPWSQYVDWYFK